MCVKLTSAIKKEAGCQVDTCPLNGGRVSIGQPILKMRGIYHLSQLASQIATRPPEWGAGAKLTPALKRGAGANWTARSQNQGPMGAQVPVLSPNDHQNQTQGQLKGFRKSNFEKFSGATKQPNQQQNSAFLGAHGVLHGPSSYYVGLWGLTPDLKRGGRCQVGTRPRVGAECQFDTRLHNDGRVST